MRHPGLLPRLGLLCRCHVLTNIHPRVVTRHAFSTSSRRRDNVNIHAEAGKHHPETRTQHATRTITDEYAVIKEKYATPKFPIVLAHGLLGFDELRLPLLGRALNLPGIQYWRGIREALEASGCEVITAAVGPTESIEHRGAALAAHIAAHARGRPVNVVAHSMGGLDARHMITRLMRRPRRQQSSSSSSSAVVDRDGDDIKTTDDEIVGGGRTDAGADTNSDVDIDVRSLTTIATPHRGSAFADFAMERVLGPTRLAATLRAMEALGIPSGAWTQLTRGYMADKFNEATPDVEGVRYFSYGAQKRPSVWSAFWLSEKIVRQAEGPNDGLVSVESSRWGDYKGTLDDVSHLDLINWTNRLKWILWQLGGMKRNFNAVALYLSIADMLAKEGL